MRKNGLTLVWILVIIIVFGLLAATVPQFNKFVQLEFEQMEFEKKVTVTEKSYDGSYPFPSADEFRESDSYSMVWIGEASWIEKRFLLVKAKKGHMDYGRIPYLLSAVSNVEKKGYRYATNWEIL